MRWDGMTVSPAKHVRIHRMADGDIVPILLHHHGGSIALCSRMTAELVWNGSRVDFDLDL